MIYIIQNVCRNERWNVVTFHGGMTLEKREQTLVTFRNYDKGHMILVASLKCGGVGLNLNDAQYVIIVDPWWNTAVEEQAFGRVFRIGQLKETALCRIFANDTVDTKIWKLQETKRKQINAIMDAKGTNREKIELSDMLSLFGLDKEGNEREEIEGNGFIIPEKESSNLPCFDDGAYEQWDQPQTTKRRRP